MFTQIKLCFSSFKSASVASLDRSGFSMRGASTDGFNYCSFVQPTKNMISSNGDSISLKARPPRSSTSAPPICSRASQTSTRSSRQEQKAHFDSERADFGANSSIEFANGRLWLESLTWAIPVVAFHSAGERSRRRSSRRAESENSFHRLPQ